MSLTGHSSWYALATLFRFWYLLWSCLPLTFRNQMLNMYWASFDLDCTFFSILLNDCNLGLATGTALTQFVVISFLLICGTLVAFIPASIVVKSHCFAMLPYALLWKSTKIISYLLLMKQTTTEDDDWILAIANPTPRNREMYSNIL